jgi:hypothetical protein
MTSTLADKAASAAPASAPASASSSAAASPAASAGPAPAVDASLAAAGAPWPGRDRLEAQREVLALVETTGELSASRYEPRDLPSAITLARIIASSPLCPPALRGREADVLLVMMTGAEMGLSTMRALRNLHVINGRVGMSAAMIRGRCQKHAECEMFEVFEADARHAVIEVKKHAWPERRRVAWTIEEAERAGLVTAESLWTKWPQEMCVARATTRAASMYFPEVTSGVLSAEELKELPGTEAAHGGNGASGAIGANGSPGENGGNSTRKRGAGVPASSPALDAFAAMAQDPHGAHGAPRKGPKRAPGRGRANGAGARRTAKA